MPKHNDFVSREDAKASLTKWLSDPRDRRDIAKVLKAIPAADVVSVVRCKECAYLLRDNSTDTCHLCMRRQHFPQEVDLDDFCSFGERWNNGA